VPGVIEVLLISSCLLIWLPFMDDVEIADEGFVVVTRRVSRWTNRLVIEFT